MAGDWIKMRVSLRRDLKTVAMTRWLSSQREFMDWWSDPVRRTCDVTVTEIVTFENVTRVTVCGLLEVWGALNEAIDSRNRVTRVTIDDLSDLAGIPLFGEAMQYVGWVRVVGDDILELPNFQEFNVPEKERSPGAERTRRWREKKRKREARGRLAETSQKNHGDVTVTPQMREEERDDGCVSTDSDETEEKREKKTSSSIEASPPRESDLDLATRLAEVYARRVNGLGGVPTIRSAILVLLGGDVAPQAIERAISNLAEERSETPSAKRPSARRFFGTGGDWEHYADPEWQAVESDEPAAPEREARW